MLVLNNNVVDVTLIYNDDNDNTRSTLSWSLMARPYSLINNKTHTEQHT